VDDELPSSSTLSISLMAESPTSSMTQSQNLILPTETVTAFSDSFTSGGGHEETKVSALVDVRCHFLHVVRLVTHKGGHEFRCVMGLQVRSLEGYKGVGRAVALVKSVRGEL